MKVYDDKLMVELKEYDLTKGHLEDAEIISKHHEAVERQVHYEVMEGTITKENPEGLRREIEDVPAQAAWDEYEAVKRYVPYTDEELAAIAEQKKEQDEEEARKELLDKLDAQVTYTALQTNTLLPSEE